MSSALWQFRSPIRVLAESICNPHRDPRHPSYNLSVDSVGELPDAAWRKRMGNQDKLIPLQLTPAAGITVAEFDEIDRPVEFGSRFDGLDLLYSGLDLDKCSGPQHWKQRVILQTDIAIKAMLEIQVLDERDRNLSPDFDHS